MRRRNVAILLAITAVLVVGLWSLLDAQRNQVFDGTVWRDQMGDTSGQATISEPIRAIDTVSALTPGASPATVTYADPLADWAIYAYNGIVDIQLNSVAVNIRIASGTSISAGPFNQLSQVVYTKVSGTPTLYVLGDAQ